MINPEKRKVAYFSMEVGLSSKIPTYSGGLGILAGDTLKASADLNFPMVGVTLLTKHGYFFQKIEDDQQLEQPMKWQVDDFLEPITEKVSVKIKGEKINIGCWMYQIEGIEGYQIPLLFLHTDLPENPEKFRHIADELYGDGSEYRLQQEIVLGIGGIRMLVKLGFNQLDRYHMNEGHSAFLALELEKDLSQPEKIREKCVFTTHTPVPAGHDKFEISLVKKFLEPELFQCLPQNYLDQGELNMTELALDYSGYVNGVAKKHTEVSKTMFPNYPIQSITNGVHAQSWVSTHFAKLYDEYIPDWRKNPSSLRNVSSIPPHKIWEAHFEGKKQIIDFANASNNAGLDYDNFTLGWARRFTSYKRPEFLLNDIEKLQQITDKVGPIQIIYAGKAHPKDIEGKKLVTEIINLSQKINHNIKMVYLPNYDMYLSKFMVGGVDAWLNTPAPPKEASGTSGMKCALNGIPHISVLDGWWHEGRVEEETGWTFSTPEELYKLLEKQIVPLFYQNHQKWQEIMKKTIMLNGSFFNAHRMLNEYIKMAYKI